MSNPLDFSNLQNLLAHFFLLPIHQPYVMSCNLVIYFVVTLYRERAEMGSNWKNGRIDSCCRLRDLHSKSMHYALIASLNVEGIAALRAWQRRQTKVVRGGVVRIPVSSVPANETSHNASAFFNK